MIERFFAVCPPGLETQLASELNALAAGRVVNENGGVSFSGSLRTAYTVNLHSRIASRVLRQAGGGGYAGEDDVYEHARGVAWERWFGADQRLRVDVSAHRSPLRSLEFATLRIKDAIVDRLREKTGARPSVNRARPDVRVFAHLAPAELTLYLDLSGEALFKRGWRAAKGEAPLKENLAAGLLALAGWTPATALLDPFCGSGTIAIEAASIAARRAPGLNRLFAFERMHDFDASAWHKLREDAVAAIDDASPAVVAGTDISKRVIDQARANARLAGLGAWLDTGRLRFDVCDSRSVVPPAATGLVVTNPPYGERSEPKSASVARLMNDVAANFKRQFGGWTAWLLTADLNLPQTMRLKESRRTVLFNGNLECRFFRFELVAGSYRPR